jgi:hypothetical protein
MERDGRDEVRGWRSEVGRRLGAKDYALATFRLRIGDLEQGLGHPAISEKGWKGNYLSKVGVLSRFSRLSSLSRSLYGLLLANFI